MGGRLTIRFSRPFSFAPVRCVHESGGWDEGRKINEKKKCFFARVTYVKIRCPRKKTSPREKRFLSEASRLSRFRSHTPFYGLLVEFVSASFFSVESPPTPSTAQWREGK